MKESLKITSESSVCSSVAKFGFVFFVADLRALRGSHTRTHMLPL